MSSPIHARYGATAEFSPGPAPAEIMWMPAGTHTIVASKNGKPCKATVQVDRETAGTMQRCLDEIKAQGGQRPFFDFDHADEAASAWPVAFAWREAPHPGVYARVEWSTPGSEAISGRAYRAFSPAFTVHPGNPAKISGAPLNMGGLVNNPAFKAINPIWAKSPQTSMNKNTQLLALLAAIAGAQADRATLVAAAQPDLAAINAKDTEIGGKLVQAKALVVEIEADPADKDELAVFRAKLELSNRENEVLKARTGTLESERTLRCKADASAAVKAAVLRGALPAQDTVLQAKWAGMIERDPGAAEMLAALPANPALSSTIIPTARGPIEVGHGLTDSIKAYSAEKDPRKAAAIYAKAIRETISKPEGFDAVILAANSVGTLAGTLITQRSLELLKFTFPALSRISTDFSAENAAFNQVVKSRIRSVPVATDYDATTGYATSNAVTVDVPVTIDQHKAVQIAFTVNDLASTRRLLFGEQEEGMHYALGKALVDQLYALFIAANYANATVQSQGGFDRSTMITIAQALTLRGVPPMGRTALLNVPYFGQLQQDSAIVSLAAFQDRSIITDYKLPPISGFQPLEAPNLPATAGLSGFFFGPDAAVIATRVPNDYTQAFPGATGGGIVSQVTNPDTGMTVMVAQFIDHKLGAAYFRVSLMFGSAVGQAASGQLLTSA